jgi:hypothetical protein
MSAEDGQGNSLQGKTEAFLDEFFQKGEVLVRELIIENDRLRAQLDAPDGPPPPASPESQEDLVGRLMKRVSVLEHECDEIRRLAGNVERESGGYRARLENLEAEHYNLACMYVAGMQLNNAATIDDVLRTVTEILLNFLGVGKFTIFGVDEERQMLFPLMREGGDPREIEEVSVSQGPLVELAALGRSWKGGDPHFKTGEELISLPLFGGTRLVGVARLENFLSQKAEFVEGDSSLLSLVSEHGGIGIETAWMRAHAKDVPLQRAAVEHLVGA